MAHKPTYGELEQGVKELEQEALERKRAEEALRKAHDELERRVKRNVFVVSRLEKNVWNELRNFLPKRLALINSCRGKPRSLGN
ncbi:MAG: hypothetical protein JRJ38_11340 [Deltaproteobacteria bacterium]|nr:hypothetical protein [Deltaproteobacteria bacterium]